MNKAYSATWGITFIPYFSITLTVLLVGAVGLLGIARDMQSIRRTIYEAQINQAKSHTERTVGRIESDLRAGRSLDEFRLENHPTWIADHWRQTIPGKPDRLYGAIVDKDNRIIAHSDNLDFASIAPAVLENDWNKQPLTEYGPDVHEITGTSLSRQTPAIDISSQITFNQKVIGTYHSGLEYRWLEGLVWNAQQHSIRGWGIILVTIGIIVALSSVLLYRLGLHTRKLKQALDQSETKRLAGLSRLIVGMAHELRNPLNAVRLNLFTTEKLFAGGSMLSQEEAVSMIHESVSEVERVNELIGQLLGYARVDPNPSSPCNVHAEIVSIINFLKQIHQRNSIEISYTNNDESIWVELGSKHLRQVLLNLLNNAREAIGREGKIAIDVQSQSNSVKICVQDSGPGIATDEYEKIFEPFYSTRDDGVGMGLAVVNSLVENVGGIVFCRRSWSLGGMEFTLQLPRSLGK